MSKAWNRPLFYFDDDDDEYTVIWRRPKAITPDEPIEEPDNSLSMGDEHLDTISSVEILVPILSEFEGIFDNTCDVPVRDDSSTFDALNDNSGILSNSNDDDTSSDDDDFEDVEYVSLKKKEEIEPDQKGLICIDNSNDPLLEIPEFESFYFDAPSFPRPPPEPLDVEICLHFELDAPVIDNFNDDQRGSEIDFSQNVEDDDSFTFIIRTFLPFLTYPADSPLLLSIGSEDTIFDPDIFI
ncbi:hypothetical protein Tco_0352393 [Tanacetum coccineum]